MVHRRINRWLCQGCRQHYPSSWQRCEFCTKWVGKGCDPEACWVKDAQCCRQCMQNTLLRSLPEEVRPDIATFLEWQPQGALPNIDWLSIVVEHVSVLAWHPSRRCFQWREWGIVASFFHLFFTWASVMCSRDYCRMCLDGIIETVVFTRLFNSCERRCCPDFAAWILSILLFVFWVFFLNRRLIIMQRVPWCKNVVHEK